MSHEKSLDSNSVTNAIAYLIVREGNKWRDVFRLAPGQITTVGRAQSNRIVIRDEICSRNHCEIFQCDSRWTLRDLGSRNGTLVNGQRVEGDWELADGQLIQIGLCEMGFTYDLSRPFPQFEDESEPQPKRDAETALDAAAVDHHPAGSEPAILHRKRKTRYLSSGIPEVVGRDRTSQELARLYRLVLDMGAARDSKQLSEVVLDGLFSGTCVDTGAILLLPRGMTGNPKPRELQVVTYKSAAQRPYQKVSSHLSSVVLSEREAILARDIDDDSRLATRDSLGEIHAKSVICAPIRVGEVINGVIHLYTTDPGHSLEVDDLEFTLALADQFAVALDNLKEKEFLADGLARAQGENELLRRQLEVESQLVGDSDPMQQLTKTIARIAPTDATVLIRGESGVGKELVARAIHFSSNRRGGPFVCMNCAALSESLLESELFGHEKGSFTGATGRKVGKFEQAHNGTLFLDEVGEMSLSVQAKFLRVLEGHPYERVGGGTPVNVNVRVVAATNRNLEQAVQEGTFRKDLYFRLHVMEILVPSLREHKSDIPLLAKHFLRRFAQQSGRLIKGFSRSAMEALMNYDWPGNVRELQNTILRAAILCTKDVVTEADIQLSNLQASKTRTPPSVAAAPREVSLEVMEQEHIMATLKSTNWNKSRAAQILGIERSTLDRKLKRYQVRRPRPQ